MKKIFALILMSLAVCVNANAEWYRQHFKADELREQEAYYANAYSCSIGQFVCWSNDNRVRVECKDGIFDAERNYVSVRVGLYKGDELVELIKYVRCWVPDGDYDHAYIDESFCHVNGEYNRNYNVGYKIIHHLKYVGVVRIIVPRYGDPDFDISIPMNPNLITDIPKIKPQEQTESIDSLTNAKDIEAAYHNIEDTINTNKKAMRNLPKDSNEYKAKKNINNTLRDRLDELDMKYYELTGEYIYNYGGEN